MPQLNETHAEAATWAGWPQHHPRLYRMHMGALRARNLDHHTWSNPVTGHFTVTAR